jgi:large subunit ribosomal protein L17
MRHKKSGRKLGRNPSHRKALLRNLAKALLIHGRITTTLAKAKDLRGVVEPLVTLALKNDLHARREAYRFLGEHKLVARLFGEIGPSFANGGGGYTRVVKLAVPRRGDAAPLAVIEFIRKPGEALPAVKAKAVPAAEPTALPAEKASPPDTAAPE